MATYYVDFVGGNDNNAGTSTATPWKRVRGMLGARNGTDATVAANAAIGNGDIINFKGGVTWQNVFPWFNVGGTVSAIRYTCDHTWFTGASFTQPIFDNQAASTSYNTDAPIVPAIGTAFYTFDDLKFIRGGPTGINPHDGTWMWLRDSHDVTITNCTFVADTGRFVIYFNFQTAGNRSNFIVTNNDVSRTGSFLWFASAANNAKEFNLVITGNTLHDYAPQLGAHTGGGNHGDGLIHIYGVNPSGGDNDDSTQYVDGITCANNRTYGDFTRGMGVGTGPEANEDMTGFFFVEGAIKNALICNNDFSMSPMGNSTGPSSVWGDGLIFLRQRGNTAVGFVWVINNTFGFDTGVSEGSALTTTESGWTGGLIIRNNIYACGSNATWNEGGGSFTGGSLDYNLYRVPNAFVPQLMTDGGHSVPGTNVNPLWVNQWNDLHLTSTSPARNTGINLSALSGLSAAQQLILNSDRNGVARPTGVTPWDIGCYQFGSGADVTPPAVPTGLTVI